MLILTRRVDQGVVIDGGIKVVVLGVERDRVKLGFEAPSGTSILREELAEANDRLLHEITQRVGIEAPRNVEVVRRALKGNNTDGGTPTLPAASVRVGTDRTQHGAG